MFDYNVQERVEDFVAAALSQVIWSFLFDIKLKCEVSKYAFKMPHLLNWQANITRTNHIMFTMGTDFKYQYAHTWFRQMDKLIHYVNIVSVLNFLKCIVLFLLPSYSRKTRGF